MSAWLRIYCCVEELALTTGRWLHVRKSWVWPAMTVASLSSVGSARLPAATATSNGLSHACGVILACTPSTPVACPGQLLRRRYQA